MSNETHRHNTNMQGEKRPTGRISWNRGSGRRQLLERESKHKMCLMNRIGWREFAGSQNEHILCWICFCIVINAAYLARVVPWDSFTDSSPWCGRIADRSVMFLAKSCYVKSGTKSTHTTNGNDSTPSKDTTSCLRAS